MNPFLQLLLNPLIKEYHKKEQWNRLFAAAKFCRQWEAGVSTLPALQKKTKKMRKTGHFFLFFCSFFQTCKKARAISPFLTKTKNVS